jgi:hypothetical protein
MTRRALEKLVAEIELQVTKPKDFEGLHRALQLNDFLDGGAREFGKDDCQIKRARAALLEYWRLHYV